MSGLMPLSDVFEVTNRYHIGIEISGNYARLISQNNKGKSIARRTLATSSVLDPHALAYLLTNDILYAVDQAIAGKAKLRVRDLSGQCDGCTVRVSLTNNIIHKLPITQWLLALKRAAAFSSFKPKAPSTAELNKLTFRHFTAKGSSRVVLGLNLTLRIDSARGFRRLVARYKPEGEPIHEVYLASSLALLSTKSLKQKLLPLVSRALDDNHGTGLTFLYLDYAPGSSARQIINALPIASWLDTLLEASRFSPLRGSGDFPAIDCNSLCRPCHS